MEQTTIEQYEEQEQYDKDEWTQFKFEDDFEQKLLAFLVRDLKFFKKNPWVKKNYFVSKIRADIYEKTTQYVDKYGEVIPKDVLRNEIQEMYITKKKQDVFIDTYWEEIDNLYARDVSVGQQYAKDKVLYFSKGQEMAQVLKDGAKTIMSGKPLETIAEGVKKVLTIGKETPKIRTCNDVDSTIGGESEDWIVKGLIAKNDVNLWYAPPGCGKSHLIWLIGNSTNDGNKCLDIENCKTPVTYIDLENTEDVRRHFKRLLGSGNMGLITLEDEDTVIPNIDSDPEKFEEFILTLSQGVVVIDTFPMVTGQTKFAESKWEVDPIIKTLRRLCSKGYTFVLVFHSLKGDPKTIKGPQELLGRCGHVVSIYTVPEVGETKETEEEPDTSDPNKPRTLFVGTGPNLKSRHKKYRYWIRADLNEGDVNPATTWMKGYIGMSGYFGGGFRRMSDPNDPIFEKIRDGLVDYLKNKEETDNYYPNQKEFTQLVITLLDCSEKQARKYIKQGAGKYWTEKVLPEHTLQYYPIFIKP